MSCSRIDYSKWDHIGDEEEDDAPQRESAHVSRLEHGSSVTIGPQGVSIAAPTEEEQQRHDDAAISAKLRAAEKYKALTRNGAEVSGSYLWAQSSDSAVVSFIVERVATSAKDIKRVALQDQRVLRIEGKDFSIEKTFRYPVVVDDIESSWEMQTCDILRSPTPTCSTGDSVVATVRLLSVTVNKEKQAAGYTLWWDCVFVGDPTIDTAAIKDRKGDATAMQKVWNEAHEMFKERVRARKAGDAPPPFTTM